MEIKEILKNSIDSYKEPNSIHIKYKHYTLLIQRKDAICVFIIKDKEQLSTPEKIFILQPPQKPDLINTSEFLHSEILKSHEKIKSQMVFCGDVNNLINKVVEFII